MFLDHLGWWSESDEYAGLSARVVLPTTQGTTLIVIPEFNNAIPYGKDTKFGDGTGTHEIAVYEVNADFTTGTRVAAFAIGGKYALPADVFAADLFSDDSLAITYQQKNGDIKYRTITYGAWTISAEETVYSNIIDVNRIDITVSDNDVPAIGATKINSDNPKLVQHTFVRGTSSGWNWADQNVIMTYIDPKPNMTDVSIQFVKGTSALVIGVLAAQTLERHDWGLEIFTSVVDEVNGTMTSAILQKRYLEGDMPTDVWKQPRRAYLFASGPGEITIAYMQGVRRKAMMLARIEWDGNTFQEVMPPQERRSNANIIIKYRFAASFANDTVNFYYVANIRGVPTVINYLARMDRNTDKVTWSGSFKWNGLLPRFNVMAGTGRNADIATRHEAIHFLENRNNVWRLYGNYSALPFAPTGVSPADSAVVFTSQPALSVRARLGREYPQSRHKVIWQFAKDAAFLTDVITYVQPDEEYQRIENTEEVDQYKRITGVLPVTHKLTQDNWYMRAAVRDEIGQQGPWSGANQITVSHPPAAANLTPSGGGQRVWNEGQILFSWNFTDPYSADEQTAYQVVVKRPSDDVVIYDTGKIESIDAFHSATMPVGSEDIQLNWEVRLWDTDSAVGIYSDPAFFIMSTVPEVVLTSPTGEEVINTGIPYAVFTPTVGGDRYLISYRVIVSQAGEVVHDSGDVPQTMASGTEVEYQAIEPAFENNQSYTIQVYVTDNTGLRSAAVNGTFTTSWLPAAAPTGIAVDTGPYARENGGYVAVTWDNNAQDDDFSNWEVHRKDDMLDAGGVIVEEGAFKKISSIYDVDEFYEYRDYMAPSGYQTSYMVVQVVDRFGDRVVSEDNEVIAVTPQANGYWLVDPTGTDIGFSAIMLKNVTEDNYTDEYEEQSFNIIGRGRHFDQGDRLGYVGSLTAQLRDNLDGSARQKKIRLESIKRENRNLYLRTPFGDMFAVYIGNMQISRIAGIGTSEFCDVTIPYSEVGQ